MALSLSSTSVSLHWMRCEFWAISSPDTATPPHYIRTESVGETQRGEGEGTHVGSLSGAVPRGGLASLGASSTLMLEDLNRSLGATHVGSLSDESDTGVDESLRLGARDLVLGCAGERNVDGGKVGPRTVASDPLEALDVSEVGEVLALELELGDLGDGLDGESLGAGGDEGSLGVGEREDGSSELNDLEGGVLQTKSKSVSISHSVERGKATHLGDVSGTRDGNELALEVLSTGLGDHVLDVVDESVSSRLGPDLGSSPVESLSCK
jgi:hypothetical protein